MSAMSAAKYIAIPLTLFSLTAVASPEIARVVALVGTVSAQVPHGPMEILATGSPLTDLDTITTQKSSYVRLKFTDGGTVTLRPDTAFRISAYHLDKAAPEKSGMVASLIQGGMRAIDGWIGHHNPGGYKVHAGVATMGVLGTRFGLLLCKGPTYEPAHSGTTPDKVTGNKPDEWHQVCPGKGLYLEVYKGKVTLTNPAGTHFYATGQYGYTANRDTQPTVMISNPDINYALPASMETSNTFLNLHGVSSSTGACLANG